MTLTIQPIGFPPMDLPVLRSDQAAGSHGAAAPVPARRGRGGGGPRLLLAVAANGRRWGLRPWGWRSGGGG